MRGKRAEVDPEPGRDARPEALEHDVGVGDECEKHRVITGVGEIEHRALRLPRLHTRVPE